jgi:hypothetical protein
MQSFINKIEQSPIRKVHTFIVLAAMLLAAQIQYIQHGWINPDSVLYFESARLFADGKWKEALQVWNWPLYPTLIAAVHKITSLKIQTSAQILNVLFFGLAAFGFTQIIRLAGGRQLTMVAGALILFSSQYIVGDVLEMLMRDEGFWAFYLTGLVFFIRFYQQLRFRDALLWQLCAITATLFRIEAITYLVLLPSLFLFSFNISFKERIRYFLISHALNIFLALGLVLTITVDGDLSIKNFGRLQEVFMLNPYDELTRRLFLQSAIMSNEVLGKYLEEFSVQGLLLTFLYVIFVKSISTAGLVNLIMAIFTVNNRTALVESKAYSVLSYAALISLVNMALIITKAFVLSSRYVVGFAFILMIFASFQFAKILKNYDQTSEKKSKSEWLAIALIVFMSLSLIKNVLPKSEGYNYMQDAANWVKYHNKENKPVFSDESRIRYYIGNAFTLNNGENWDAVSREIDNHQIQSYDYLLISHSAKYPEREKIITDKLPQYKEVKRFNSVKSKKSIVIYQKRAN